MSSAWGDGSPTYSRPNHHLLTAYSLPTFPNALPTHYLLYLRPHLDGCKGLPGEESELTRYLRVIEAGGGGARLGRVPHAHLVHYSALHGALQCITVHYMVHDIVHSIAHCIAHDGLSGVPHAHRAHERPAAHDPHRGDADVLGHLVGVIAACMPRCIPGPTPECTKSRVHVRKYTLSVRHC